MVCSAERNCGHRIWWASQTLPTLTFYGKRQVEPASCYRGGTVAAPPDQTEYSASETEVPYALFASAFPVLEDRNPTARFVITLLPDRVQSYSLRKYAKQFLWLIIKKIARMCTALAEQVSTIAPAIACAQTPVVESDRGVSAYTAFQPHNSF